MWLYLQQQQSELHRSHPDSFVLGDWRGPAVCLLHHALVCQMPAGLLEVTEGRLMDALRLLAERTDDCGFSLVGHGRCPEKQVALVEGDALAAALAAAATGTSPGAGLLRFISRFFAEIVECSNGQIQPALANKAAMWLLAHGVQKGSKQPPHPHGPASVFAAPDGAGRKSALRDKELKQREMLIVLRIAVGPAGSPLLLQPPGANQPFAVCPDGPIFAYGLTAQGQGRDIESAAMPAILAGLRPPGACRTLHGVTPRGTCVPEGYVWLSALLWHRCLDTESDADAAGVTRDTLDRVTKKLAAEGGLPLSAAEAGLPTALPLLDASAPGFLEDRYRGSPAMAAFCSRLQAVIPSSLAFAKMASFKPLLQPLAQQLVGHKLHPSAFAHPGILIWLLRLAIVTAQPGSPAYAYRLSLSPSQLLRMQSRVQHEGPSAIRLALEGYSAAAALLSPEQHAAARRQLLPSCHNMQAAWWLLRHSPAEAETVLIGLEPWERSSIRALMAAPFDTLRLAAEGLLDASMQAAPPTAAYELQQRAAFCLASTQLGDSHLYRALAAFWERLTGEMSNLFWLGGVPVGVVAGDGSCTGLPRVMAVPSGLAVPCRLGICGAPGARGMGGTHAVPRAAAGEGGGCCSGQRLAI